MVPCRITFTHEGSYLLGLAGGVSVLWRSSDHPVRRRRSRGIQGPGLRVEQGMIESHEVLVPPVRGEGPGWSVTG